MKKFESPVIEIIEVVDVITTSGNPDELPDDEF